MAADQSSHDEAASAAAYIGGGVSTIGGGILGALLAQRSPMLDLDQHTGHPT